jgi:ferric-dicitrate binding protein FerR (iron transport regulator)
MAETKLGLQAAVMDGAEKHESAFVPLQSEAHAWVRRLVSGEATETDAVALRRWCDQSPAHAAAFSEASQFWNAFGPAGRSLLREQDVATAPAASRNPRMAVVTAWQHGLLIFNMTPLADVVEELNRYRVGRIVLLNNAVGQRPVNGRFRIDQPDEALLQIERAFGVRGRSLPGGFVLLS